MFNEQNNLVIPGDDLARREAVDMVALASTRARGAAVGFSKQDLHNDRHVGLRGRCSRIFSMIARTRCDRWQWAR